jgi:tRNA G10  N-methylase Trm11
MMRRMEQTHDYAFILGTTPELSLAEIQAVVKPPFIVSDRKSIGLLHLPHPINVSAVMARLGGTVKIATLTQEYARVEDIDLPTLAKLVPDNGGRAIFGVTVYQAEQVMGEKQMRAASKQLGLELKNWFKEGGRGARLVVNQDGGPLSAVTIDREKLLTKGREIILVLQRHHIHVGVTTAVQPYEEWGKRDFGRPARSMKTGMLPPKVARMMINLADPKPGARILDPFVGTGTVLQEAATLGFQNLEGNDIDRKALDYTRENLAWAKLPKVKLHNYKAERLTNHIKSGVYDHIIFEGYLGPTDEHVMRRKGTELVSEMHEMYATALDQFAQLLTPIGNIVGAFPAWRPVGQHQIQTLPIQHLAEQAGLKVVAGPFIYGRTDAYVLRQIWVLRKA